MLSKSLSKCNVRDNGRKDRDIEGVFLEERVAGSGIFSDLHIDIKYLLSLRNNRKTQPSE